MRMLLIAASALALLAADGAGAQRMAIAGAGAGRASGSGYYPAPTVRPASRWGSSVNGRWWAGANAPGGWNAYRRPTRGWNLPSYWVASSFAIGDWAGYGLGQPPAGYGWTRYYDDAVLIDGNGRVYDCVQGVDWNRGGYAYDSSESYDTVYAAQPQQRDYAPPQTYAPPPAYATQGYVQPTYGQSTYPTGPSATAGYAPDAGYAPNGYAPGAGYAQPGYTQPGYVERRNSGVGGALVGAGVGAVAGNVIAGRGHRLEGTLIGAGVGGVAGYAIDRSSTHRVPVAPREGYGYPPPPAYAPAPAYAPPPPPPGPAGTWHSPDGGTTVTTTSVGGYNGGSTTVVTVQTAPVVTTTMTEIVEDGVTYARPHRPVRHKWVRRPTCGC